MSSTSEAGEETEPEVVSGPGERLRVAREAANMDLNAVALQLHLGADVLAALERDDYDALPVQVFVQGYLRKYARFLGESEEAIIQAYEKRVPETVSQDGPRIFASGVRPEVRSSHYLVRAVTWLIVGSLIVLLAIWWWGYIQWPGEESAESGAAEPNVTTVLPSINAVREAPESRPLLPEAVDETVVPTAPAEPLPETPGDSAAVEVDHPASTVSVQSPEESAEPEAAAPSVPDDAVVIRLSDTSWVNIRDAGGRFRIIGNLAAGTQRILEGEPPYSVVLGNAAAVELTVAGEPYDLRRHTRGKVAKFQFDPRPVPAP